MARIVRRWTPLHSFGAALACVLLPLVALLLLAWLDLGDRLRAYPSPERHAGVALIATLPALAPSTLERGDFDGDGVTDELSVDYFHMRPFGRPATSGMIRVRSGQSGELLLAHAVPSPLAEAYWCGDIDGGGSDDLAVPKGGQWIVLGMRTDP